jgi:hypothetical protein
MGMPVTAAALSGAIAESARWNEAVADLLMFIEA